MVYIMDIFFKNTFCGTNGHCVIPTLWEYPVYEIVVGMGLLHAYQTSCVCVTCDRNIGCLSACEQTECSHSAGRGHSREQLDLHLFPEPPDP